MQNLKELKVSESFALEINLQSSFFIPFYAALVKEASNDLPELDFFFLCYDYKLIPASHRITTERLMYEYFIADGCPHRIWISDAIKAEV